MNPKIDSLVLTLLRSLLKFTTIETLNQSSYDISLIGFLQAC
ncbi:hypothetical protein GXM_02233 [Nostoc sphaeroides CCNUC1]|uniref:Uncharacterized protein n=1 Tax=Nostoc sphaeroides CCNUC1 TaxID=2653204 RepID=A0A5P8VWH0_9NOSO|nr:hypothetical protein GXM_02233 [Nostoc sphaeroides CCNUC1]